MSEQRRRRLRPAQAPRRVGEPNVLSNQATPNRLSTMGTDGRSSNPVAAQAASPAAPSTRPVRMPRAPSGRPVQAPPDEAPPRTRRLPSLSTLIFVGFLIFTAGRFITNLGSGDAGPTAAPAPGEVGIVTFGQGLGDDCELTQAGDNFPSGVDVWWRAEFTREQAPEATVVVRAYRDEGQIDRYEVPPEPELGPWDVLCAGEPVRSDQPGAYRVEIWDGSEQAILATGGYTKPE